MTDFCAKKTFKTRKVARSKAKELKRTKGIELTPYFCEKCDGWHNTGQDKKSSRKYTRKINYEKSNADSK